MMFNHKISPYSKALEVEKQKHEEETKTLQRDIDTLGKKLQVANESIDGK